MARRSSVLWVAGHVDTAGQWESIQTACWVLEADHVNSKVIAVARRAGLPVVEAPDHVAKVCILAHTCHHWQPD